VRSFAVSAVHLLAKLFSITNNEDYTGGGLAK
jgi:hypothetical protein